MSFTVKSRVNHPLAIMLDEQNSLHLGPLDTKEIANDEYRECVGIRNAVRSNMLIIMPNLVQPSPNQQNTQALNTAAPAEQKGNK